MAGNPVIAVLPELRQNLRLLPGSPDEDGAPRWLLYDNVRNRYFVLSSLALDLVRLWRPGVELDVFLKSLQDLGLNFSQAEVAAFIDFLTANNLILARNPQANERIYRQHIATLQSFWRWLLHHYLFIRIPLIRPDRWLAAWTPRLEWLFSPFVHYLLLVLGGIGFVLVLRQWEAFWATFLHFFTLQGLLLYGVTLAFVKSAHELGHAFAARRQGCRVASMGVALLVMFPVLYTDTTDAWKLKSRRARLRIVTAGVRTELYLALLATFLWNLLPDGGLRSVAFFVATTSWVTSLLVNISPFLRFDGYYAFSDLLGVENLQQRAFAYGRWKMRKWLWGLNDPLPEPMPRYRANLLISYAWATWLYRFFLFLGIALLVYHFFFKVLGILLFVVEILWFILIPVFRELVVWRKRNAEFVFSAPRLIGWGCLAALLLCVSLPLQTSVYLPAVLRAQQEQTLFAPQDAVVKAVHVALGDQVSPGQPLLTLDSKQLSFELAQVTEAIGMIRHSLDRSAASLRDKADRMISEQQLQRQLEQQSGLRAQLDRLVLRAPFAGEVSQLEQLHAGRWVNTDMALLAVVNQRATWEVDGFAGEPELPLIETGQDGVFVADGGDLSTIPVRIESVDVGAVFSLPFPELGSESGGHIAVRRVGERHLIPDDARYRVNLSLPQGAPFSLVARVPGMVVVDGAPRSWLGEQLRRLFAIALRESGF